MTEFEKDIYIQLLELYIIDVDQKNKMDELQKSFIDAIEKHKRDNPVAPISVPIHWNKNCTACGLKLDGPMGYVCPNSRCPSGLGNVFVD